MNLLLLNEKIKDMKIPITAIADKMGISRQSLYQKLDGKSSFKITEAQKICDILKLTNHEKTQIFFND